MTEQVMDTNALPVFLSTTLKTNRVRVRSSSYTVTIEPADEKNDCTIGLRGILSDYPEMTVNEFLNRKYTDKELDI